MCGTAYKNKLAKSEKAAQQIRRNGTYGYYACGLYSLCAILAFWFPLTIATITTATWIFWLIYGISIKHEEMN